MDIGAASENIDASLGAVGSGETLSQNAGTSESALLALLELLGTSNLQRHGLAGDSVHQRTTLLPRENSGVQLLGVLLLGQNHARTRATESLVNGGRHNVRMRNRRRVQTGGNQTCEVRHVRPQLRADLIGDGAESFEVEVARVRRPTCDENIRLFCERLLTHLVHIDPHGVLIHTVCGDVVELAGEVQLHAVGQVTAVCQVEAHNLVTGVDQRMQNGSVCLRTCVWLNVGELSAEELLGAVACHVLDDVDVFAATVVTTARVAFGVLVGQNRALSLQHCTWNKVLTGNHFEHVTLTRELPCHCLCEVGIEFTQRLVADIVIVRPGHE